MNNWKARATFLSRNCVTRTLGLGDGAQDVDFYAISPAMLGRLRGIARPLAQALTCLFEDKSKDTKRSFRDTTDSKEGVTVSESVSEAIDADVLRERAARREQAIDRLIDAFSDPKNYLLLLEIVWNSMRGVFGAKPPTEEELQALADDPDLDLPILIEMLKGVAAANFDSLTGWTGKLGKTLGKRLEVEMERAIQTSLPIDEEDPKPSEARESAA